MSRSDSRSGGVSSAAPGSVTDPGARHQAPETPEAAGALRSWPRRPQRLATAVVEELVDRIVGGELPVGTTLPIEPLLCEMFAVSRTVIREAVKTLEANRLVTVQQGSGTTINDAGDWNLLDPVVLAASIRHDAERAILEDLIAVRRSLESQMAAQAAAVADEEHRARMAACLERLHQEEEDTARFLRADLDFHYAIMAASGNRLGRAVIQTINDQAFQSLRYIGGPTREDCRASNEGHRAIFEAIIAGDEAAAARAMDDHIRESWVRRRPDAKR